MRIRLFLGLAGLLLASAAAATLPGPMQRELARAGIPASAVALDLREAGATGALLQHRARAPMNPASTMKLLTTYAALEILGPNYTWKTPAYLAGELREGTLLGDLYLQGSGDPKISFEALNGFLHQLRSQGLAHIQGDLVLDRSRFALPPHDAAAFDNEPQKAYNVGPDALLFNFKTIRFLFSIDAAQNQPRVRAEPHPAGLTLDAQLTPAAGPCNNWRAKVEARFDSAPGQAMVSFRGAFPLACEEQSWWVSLFDHAPLLGQSFQSMWQAQGGSLSGGWREGRVPALAKPFAQLESPPLAEVIRDINKRSNNVMARQLFLTMAAPEAGQVATLPAAQARLAAWLKGKRLHFRELAVENGAGLSRHDRISAEHLAQVLQDAWASTVMPEFLASLPVSATDGTLQHRMLGRPAAGRAHLKTGSLDEVRALAGYLLDARGRRYVLVALVNHPRAAAAQPALDALVDWVVSRTEGGRGAKGHEAS
ncbi:partial serine-type D-Ala-D-Ala carboxypeptidase/endopeptidase (penicillin-binding protein 4), partial [Burkholderiales bacterium]